MEPNSKYPRRQRKPEIHRLTIEQIKHLLEAVQEHPLKALLTVAVTTGLRRQELLSLQWEDIDRENETLHVRRMVSSIGSRESTETARTIALPTIAFHALNEHQRSQEEAHTNAGAAWHDLNLVFPNEVGQYFNPEKFRQQYHDLFAAVGLPHLHFHELRHGTAALLLEMGVSIAVIRAILGFRYQSTTIQTLMPVSLSMQKDAMRKWDTLLSETDIELPSHTIRVHFAA